jgi:hypothetical protein
VAFPTRPLGKTVSKHLVLAAIAVFAMIVVTLLADKLSTLAKIGVIAALLMAIILFELFHRRRSVGRYDVLVISRSGLRVEQHNFKFEREVTIPWEHITRLGFLEPHRWFNTHAVSLFNIDRVEGPISIEVFRTIDCENAILDLIDRFRSAWESKLTDEEKVRMKEERAILSRAFASKYGLALIKPSDHDNAAKSNRD